MNITDKTSKICETCTLGKMTEFTSQLPDEKAKLPLELVHCDLAGPVDPVSIDGYRYALSFTDDYSGLIMTYFLKQKSGTIESTKKFLADVSPFGKVKCLRSDLTVKPLRSIMAQHLFQKSLKPCWLVMVHAMKSLLPIHPIRMEQQRGAGAHYLRWGDVY